MSTNLSVQFVCLIILFVCKCERELAGYVGIYVHVCEYVHRKQVYSTSQKEKKGHALIVSLSSSSSTVCPPSSHHKEGLVTGDVY